MSIVRPNSTISGSEGNFTESLQNATGQPIELHPYGVLVTVACVWILVAAVGIIGNAMVILSAIVSRHVRTKTNVLVVNLSVADLWTSLSLPWSSVALISNGHWPLASEVPCEIAAFMWHTGLGVSIYNLALISLNRLVRITRPRSNYDWLFTPRKMVCIVALSWIIPIFIIVLPIAIGAGSLGHDLKHDTCTDDDLHPRANDYNLAQAVGFYPVPLVAVVASYVIIYIYIRRHFRKKFNKNKNTGQISGTSMDPVEPSGTSVMSNSSADELESAQKKNKRPKHKKVNRQELQITKNLFWVFCAFMLCISPYFISLFIPTSEKFALYGATILIFNSCINPIIYAAKHPQFKMVIQPMLRCRWGQIPQPSWILQVILSRFNAENSG